MQHAGDALWHVWGMVAYLNKVGQPLLALNLQQAASLIGTHIGVAPPPPEVLAQLSSMLENLQPPTGSVGYAAEQQQPTSSRGRSKYDNPDVVSAALTVVAQMVDSGQFDWANLVESVHTQLEGEKPFITPKQCSAIRNIADGRKYGEDEGTFWEWLNDEYPEAAKLVAAEADKA